MRYSTLAAIGALLCLAYFLIADVTFILNELAYRCSSGDLADTRPNIMIVALGAQLKLLAFIGVTVLYVVK